MPQQKRDLRDCLTAYDCRDQLPELSNWMTQDRLKELTLWKGSRFEAGEEYFDLHNPERGPFVATGNEGPPTSHAYVDRRQATAPAWAELITWRQPISESQGEAIARQAEDAAPAPAQSGAGIARGPRQPETAPRGRQHGVVDRLLADRGFGVIRSDDNQEYFFHRSALQAVRFADLAPGVTVTFAVGDDPGDQPGEEPRAVSVQLASDAMPAVDNETLPQEKVVYNDNP
ncbi:MAG: cold-shock protein [Thermomicrobiales bacterium]